MFREASVRDIDTAFVLTERKKEKGLKMIFSEKKTHYGK